MSYLKVVPERSLGRTIVLPANPVFGAYVRKRLPWYSYPGIRMVEASPLYQGFGGFGIPEAAVPFTLAPDPVAAFISGIQTFLGLDPSGKWDEATHNAVVAYVATLSTAAAWESLVDLGKWGEHPAAVANTTVQLLSVPILPGTWSIAEARMPEFIGALGIPATSAETTEAWYLANQGPLAAFGPKVVETIVVAETSMCPSWLMTGLIGAGALALGLGIGWAVWGRKA